MPTATRCSAPSTRPSSLTRDRNEQAIRLCRRHGGKDRQLYRDRPRALCLHRRRRPQYRGDRRRRLRHGDRCPGHPGDGAQGGRAHRPGHRQAGQACGAVALSCGAGARGVRLWSERNHRVGPVPGDDRGARPGGLGVRIRPFPAPVPGRRDDPRSHLAHPDIFRHTDALSRPAPRRSHVARARPYGGRHRGLGARFSGHVFGRPRGVPLRVLLRRCPFRRLARDA
jgi:hypothetical protein